MIVPRVELLTNESTNTTTAVPNAFAGGRLSVYVQPDSVVGTEVVHIGHKPTGGAGDYKWIAIPSGRFTEALNLELWGATDVVAKLQGVADDGSTDITVEINS